MTGVLVIDKPQGLTSHDVVAAARRALGERRIGHCGTLDPMATGVLPLAIGTATRFVQFLAGATKQYDAVVRFGRETDTYDATGEVVSESAGRPTPESLAAALDAFRGGFPQAPPAFSAKKVEGVRAYALARRNPGTPALPPVPVTCHDLTLTAFDGDRAWLSMSVSAGFYVRSLASDLGRRVGTGAVLDALRRTRAGDFGLETAMPFDLLMETGPAGAAPFLIPVDRLLPDLPVLPLRPADAERVRHGLDVPLPPEWAAPPDLTRLVEDEGRRLVALAVPARRAGFLHPSVVLG